MIISFGSYPSEEGPYYKDLDKLCEIWYNIISSYLGSFLPVRPKIHKFDETNKTEVIVELPDKDIDKYDIIRVMLHNLPKKWPEYVIQEVKKITGDKNIEYIENEDNEDKNNENNENTIEDIENS